MKNELKQVETCVQTFVENEANDFRAFQQEFLEELSRVRETITETVLHCDSGSRIENYIRFHQAGITHCSDQIYPVLHENPEKQEHIIPMLEALEQEIDFLRQRFGRYISDDEKLTDYTRVRAEQQLRVGLGGLLRNLKNRGVQEDLLSIIHSLLRRNTMQELPLTYRRLSLLQELKAALKTIAGHYRQHTNYTRKVSLLMCSLNVNSREMFLCCRGQIVQAINILERKDEQLDTLAFYRKSLSQLQLRPGLSLEPGSLPLTQLLCNWISEEMTFIENRKSRFAVHLPQESKPGYKIQLGLSVAQLALLLRVMVQEDLIVSDNLTQLFTFIVTVCKTRKTENISFESLRNHYYDFESSTITSLKGKVIGMVNYLNKMYGV